MDDLGFPECRRPGDKSWITVANLANWNKRQGMSPDEIEYRYPSITISDAYAALAYDFEFRERNAAHGGDDPLPPG